jgi:hypothetical protein
MPRRAEGDRPLTPAERQARQREKRAADAAKLRDALARIAEVRTAAEARQIAADALSN